MKALPPVEEEIRPLQVSTTGKNPQGYISLLEIEPYVVPPVLSQPLGLPSNPRLVLPVSEKNAEFKLTPDTLRFMGQTVEHIRTQISEVQMAHTAADQRSMIQASEFQRQVGKCQQVMSLLEKLKGERRERTLDRLTKIQETQGALLSRLDTTLQGMMRRTSPELSENETKWFEELKRMKGEMLGAGKYDEESLRARAKLVCFFWNLFSADSSYEGSHLQLQREYERLLPELKKLHQKELERKKKLGETANQSFGVSQAFELGQRSNEGYVHDS